MTGSSYEEAVAGFVSAGSSGTSTRRWTGSGDLTDLLGDPQRAYPVIHITGTNGKTSTARMIDALLRERGLRTGRFTSPHLHDDPRADQRRRRAGQRRAVRRGLRRGRCRTWSWSTHQHDAPLSFFEVLTAMAFAAFADAPVDVAVIEVGLGGAWDATNVADGAGRGHHADRARPRELPRRHRRGDRRREGRDHQARRGRGARPAAGRGRRGAAAPRRRGRRDRGPRGPRVRRAPAGSWRSAGSCSRSRACAATTTRSSCRCSARTRRTTRPARSPRSRRSPGRATVSRGGASSTPTLDPTARRVRRRRSPGRLEVVRPGRPSSSTPRTTRPAWRPPRPR